MQISAKTITQLDQTYDSCHLKRLINSCASHGQFYSLLGLLMLNVIISRLLYPTTVLSSITFSVLDPV